MEIPSTDFLCIFPFVQQGIGACTIASNLVKVIYDLARAIFTKTWKGPDALYLKRGHAKNQPDEFEKINKEILAYPGYQFEQHTLYLLIGFIRAIPSFGSLYSLGRIRKYIEFKQKIDVPNHLLLAQN